MDVSRVTLTNETRLAMENNPLLKDGRAKSKFRKAKILEYIRSKPAGSHFGIGELITAGGYTSKQYGTGWAFIQRMVKDKIIWIEKTDKFKKLVTIPGDAKTVAEATKPKAESKKPEEKNVVNDDLQKPDREHLGVYSPNKPTLKIEVPKKLYRVEDIRGRAKQFAWEHNSDSLRDFIATLR